jgi:DNA-binding HxlR family transcriptional regulator
MVASNSKARKPTPLPGRAVRGSQTGRPEMALLDLLGRRWALRVLWELRAEEALTFRELQSRCGNISSSVLNDRLRELRESLIIETDPAGGYRLTGDGRALLQALSPISAWAKRWARRTARAQTGQPSRRDTSPEVGGDVRVVAPD